MTRCRSHDARLVIPHLVISVNLSLMLNHPSLLNEWHAVAAVEQLTLNKPFAARLLGVDLVLWQSTDGINVWQDLCVHRGARLSMGKVVDNCLHCPYHGWVYNQSGQCIKIPAHPEQTPPEKARANQFLVQIKHDLIWVCMGEPNHNIPDFTEWNDPDYRNIMSGPYEFAALGPRVIENFLDVAHFPFVHEGSLGDPTHPEIADYEATFDEHGVVAEGISVWQPDPDGTGQGAHVTYTYKVFRPLVAYFVKTKGPSFAALYAVCPVDETTSRGWVLMSMNYGFDQDAAEIRRFQDAVTGEDIPIVESQRPELLPLDLQQELHLKSDRIAIAYRQWLHAENYVFGVA